MEANCRIETAAGYVCELISSSSVSTSLRAIASPSPDPSPGGARQERPKARPRCSSVMPGPAMHALAFGDVARELKERRLEAAEGVRGERGRGDAAGHGCARSTLMRARSLVLERCRVAAWCDSAMGVVSAPARFVTGVPGCAHAWLYNCSARALPLPDVASRISSRRGLGRRCRSGNRWRRTRRRS